MREDYGFFREKYSLNMMNIIWKEWYNIVIRIYLIWVLNIR
jgi:hypothetical protein